MINQHACFLSDTHTYTHISQSVFISCTIYLHRADVFSLLIYIIATPNCIPELKRTSSEYIEQMTKPQSERGISDRWNGSRRAAKGQRQWCKVARCLWVRISCLLETKKEQANMACLGNKTCRLDGDFWQHPLLGGLRSHHTHSSYIKSNINLSPHLAWQHLSLFCSDKFAIIAPKP